MHTDIGDRDQRSGLRTWPAWALGFVSVLGSLACSGSGGCSAGELAVLEEITRYDGQEIEPGPAGPGFASCNTRYPANAPKGAILAYYSDRLRQNGWEVEAQGASILDAKRNGYRYRVDYRGRMQSTPEGDTTVEDVVFVRVSEQSES